MKRTHLFMVGTVVLITAVTGGWMFSQRADDDLFELKKNFEIFGALYQEIVVNYVDDIRPGPFMTAGVDAMMSRLDPYSRYYDQAVNADMDLLRRGPKLVDLLATGLTSINVRGKLRVVGQPPRHQHHLFRS